MPHEEVHEVYTLAASARCAPLVLDNISAARFVFDSPLSMLRLIEYIPAGYTTELAQGWLSLYDQQHSSLNSSWFLGGI